MSSAVNGIHLVAVQCTVANNVYVAISFSCLHLLFSTVINIVWHLYGRSQTFLKIHGDIAEVMLKSVKWNLWNILGSLTSHSLKTQPNSKPPGTGTNKNKYPVLKAVLVHTHDWEPFPTSPYIHSFTTPVFVQFRNFTTLNMETRLELDCTTARTLYSERPVRWNHILVVCCYCNQFPNTEKYEMWNLHDQL